MSFRSSLLALASLPFVSGPVWADPQPTPEAPPVAKPEPKKKPWGGLRMTSEDKAFSLRVGGQFNVDATVFPNDQAQAQNDEVRIRRARLQVRATTARYFDFRFLFDVTDARLQILDAVLETNALEEVKLRLGKDKSPVSFDRLQSSTALHLLERSPTAGMTGNRDIGVQLAGKIDGGLIDYQLGLWDGTVDGASTEQNVGDTFDFAGRVTFQPFIHAGLPALANLQLGVSGSYGKEAGTATATQLATYRTSGRATWFRYASGADLATTAVADGDRVRLGGHLLWQYGPVLVFAEVIQSSQAITLADRTEDISHLGFAAQASWVLTGDDASWTGLTPDCPFDPAAGGWGAFELVARWGGVIIDDLAFDAGFADPTRSARRLDLFGVGLNWYLDRSLKLQANVDVSSFEDGAAGGDRDTETLVGLRAQLLF